MQIAYELNNTHNRKLKIIGGKIGASMTVIIEKDKALQMYLNYEFIMILRRKKKTLVTFRR